MVGDRKTYRSGGTMFSTLIKAILDWLKGLFKKDPPSKLKELNTWHET